MPISTNMDVSVSSLYSLAHCKAMYHKTQDIMQQLASVNQYNQLLYILFDKKSVYYLIYVDMMNIFVIKTQNLMTKYSQLFFSVS